MDEPTSVPKSSLVFESTSVFELLHQVFLIFEYTPMDQRRKDNVVPLSQEEEIEVGGRKCSHCLLYKATNK
jgi:hypothetical protein